jgi:hypothetical protein
MMPYQSYQLWDTARAKTTSEQRAADERLGKLAAAISGSFSQARRKVRAAAGLRAELGRSARTPAGTIEDRTGGAMRYMLIHCVDERIELSPDQAAEVEASTSAWTEQTIRDGLSVHGAYLEPVCEARTVRLRASEVLVTDGPFAETKEQIGGYDVIECADLDQAIAVASRHPVARIGTIEVRPLQQRADDR